MDPIHNTSSSPRRHHYKLSLQHPRPPVPFSKSLLLQLYFVLILTFTPLPFLPVRSVSLPEQGPLLLPPLPTVLDQTLNSSRRLSSNLPRKSLCTSGRLQITSSSVLFIATLGPPPPPSLSLPRLSSNPLFIHPEPMPDPQPLSLQRGTSTREIP